MEGKKNKEDINNRRNNSKRSGEESMENENDTDNTDKTNKTGNKDKTDKTNKTDNKDKTDKTNETDNKDKTDKTNKTGNNAPELNQMGGRLRLFITGKYQQLCGKRWAVISLLVLSLAGCIFASLQIIGRQISYHRAREEYARLRQYFPAGTDSPKPSPAQLLPPDFPVLPDFPVVSDLAVLPDLSVLTTNLSAINPDYTGWIRIAGTAIDYPIVRGQNNDTYMTTTFSGEVNSAGTIFMDYQCREGFETPVTILYGHNMRDGSMFAALKNYLKKDFLAAHPEISIIDAEKESLVYRIFEVRVTDVNDKAYQLLNGGEALAPDEAVFDRPAIASERNILILSTCTDSRDEEERLIILAVRDF